MQELDFGTLYAVLFEMMGFLLWALVFVAAFGIGGFTFVYMKERVLQSKRLVRSEIIGVLGGFIALVVMAQVTVSGFTDAGGPVDWLLVGLIWGTGLLGTTVLAYAVMGLLEMRKPS